jgi:hypothetical protein
MMESSLTCFIVLLLLLASPASRGMMGGEITVASLSHHLLHRPQIIQFLRAPVGRLPLRIRPAGLNGIIRRARD